MVVLAELEEIDREVDETDEPTEEAEDEAECALSDTEVRGKNPTKGACTPFIP